jgi:hypothetical protein
VLELIDVPERIAEFLAVVAELAPGAFVTREMVDLLARRDGQAQALDDAEA